MARRATISPKLKAMAHTEVERQLADGYEPTIHDQRRMNAALGILKLADTQERYALDQQTPADFARAALNPKTRAAELDRLTEDNLLDLQAKLAGDYPGKPA